MSLRMGRSSSNSSSSSGEMLAHELIASTSGAVKDIDTLRKLAKAKTKRKHSALEPTLSNQPPAKKPALEEGELEDGEIGDSDPDIEKPVASTSTTIHPAAEDNSLLFTSGRLYSLPPRPSAYVEPSGPSQSSKHMNPASSSFIPRFREKEKDDCKVLVAELSSWGITAEYFVAYGISKDLLVTCLHELNLKIPPHLQHLIPRNGLLNTLSSPSRNGQSPLRPQQPPPPPIQSNIRAFPPPSPPASYEDSGPAILPPPSGQSAEDLANMEAKRRALLLARKHAMVQRKADSAKTLHSEIDNLFALSQAEVASDHDSGSSASITEEVDMALDSPPPESASIDTIPPLFTPAAMPSVPVTGRRPKATDFEAEPTHALPQHPRRNGVFVPPQMRHNSSLIIEVSEGEDDNEEDSDSSDIKNSGSDKQPSSTSSIRPPLPRINTAPGEPDQRTKALLTKEQEIKKMQDMIKRMEEKKKAKTTDSRQATPIATPTVGPTPLPSPSTESVALESQSMKEESPAPQSLERVSSSQSGKEQIEEAKAQVEQLIDERNELVDQVNGTDAPAASSSFHVESSAAAELQDYEEDVDMDIQSPTEESMPDLPGIDVDTTMASSEPRQDDLTSAQEETVASAHEPESEATTSTAEVQSSSIADEEAIQANTQISQPPTNDGMEPLSVPTRFVSYRSPLGSWARQPTLPASTSNKSSLAPSAAAVRPTPAGLQNWMARKAGKDVNAQLCRFEVDGTCNDKNCPSTHVRDFQATEEDLLEYFVASYNIAGSTKADLVGQGVSLIFKRYKQPLADLPALLLDVHNFMTQP